MNTRWSISQIVRGLRRRSASSRDSRNCLFTACSGQSRMSANETNSDHNKLSCCIQFSSIRPRTSLADAEGVPAKPDSAAKLLFVIPLAPPMTRTILSFDMFIEDTITRISRGGQWRMIAACGAIE